MKYVFLALLLTGCATTQTVEVPVPVVVKPKVVKCFQPLDVAKLPEVGPARSLAVANILKNNHACAAYLDAVLD